MSEGAKRILAERKRQISRWSPEHDDDHHKGELALAAICYATPRKIFVRRDYADRIAFDDPWPWDGSDDNRAGRGDTRYGRKHAGANYAPDPETYNAAERLDLLVKAGALLAAEIDRQLRLRTGKKL